MITVFTPTYNRAHLLRQLFDSLSKQTSCKFEWIIVDDGSEDNTASVVEKFSSEERATFTIRYIRQENGGKHRAINRGVKEAKGELFFIVDSDDTLPYNSIETIEKHYKDIEGDKSFGGVCGYIAHADGTIIGHGADKDILDATSLEMRYRYGIKGDMCEVFRTSVLREFPFPEIEGEKFCPEALLWNRISQKYKLRIFQKVIYYRDYLDGGLTNNIVRIRMQSPIASMTTYAELNSYNIPLKQKIKSAINYWRFRFCSDKDNIPTLSWQYQWTAPLGWLMHMRDKRNVEK